MTVTPEPATFLLVPGAGGDGWLWHRVVDELRARGHDPVAVTLPTADPEAGLDAYTDAVVTAARGHETRPLVVVGQSIGGFTAPLAAARLGADLLVLLNAMVPRRGESAAQWWGATGHDEARREQAAREGRVLDGDPDGDGVDALAEFFHDVPPDVTAAALARGDGQESPVAFSDPWPLAAWPDVPTRVLQGGDDRFFPPAFQQRVARERLGLEVEVMPGGHLLPLSRPVELADRLVAHLSAPRGAPAVRAGSR